MERGRLARAFPVSDPHTATFEISTTRGARRFRRRHYAFFLRRPRDLRDARFA
jgi:hypothetical protein